MFKLTFLGVLLLKGFFVSGYFAFFHGKPKTINATLIEASNAYLADALNEYIKREPSEKLNTLVDNLNWIIDNDYQRDIRVKRVIHQDLKSLVEIHTLLLKLDRPDEVALEVYNSSLDTIVNRTHKLRYIKDEYIRDEILLLGDMIEGNER